MSGQKGLVVACRFIGAIFLIVFLMTIPVFAQTSGTILGTVKDASGGLVAEQTWRSRIVRQASLAMP